MEPRTARLRPQAQADIAGEFLYLARTAGSGVALRFHEDLEAALNRLSETPGMGTPQQMLAPQLTGVRMWVLRVFRNHLVYYREVPDGIEVLRVLHAAQDRSDLHNLLEDS